MAASSDQSGTSKRAALDAFLADVSALLHAALVIILDLCTVSLLRVDYCSWREENTPDIMRVGSSGPTLYVVVGDRIGTNYDV